MNDFLAEPIKIHGFNGSQVGGLLVSYFKQENLVKWAPQAILKYRRTLAPDDYYGRANGI
jgi:hypothetical protein